MQTQPAAITSYQRSAAELSLTANPTSQTRIPRSSTWWHRKHAPRFQLRVMMTTSPAPTAMLIMRLMGGCPSNCFSDERILGLTLLLYGSRRASRLPFRKSPGASRAQRPTQHSLFDTWEHSSVKGCRPLRDRSSW